MVTDFEPIESNFCIQAGGGWQPDLFPDDQALLIKTRQGLVVILGCAHRGIVNTLYHARTVSGMNKIQFVLGGCHLFTASDERIWQTISALNELRVQKLGVSHCTGMHAALLLGQTYGNDFNFNLAGSTITLE